MKVIELNPTPPELNALLQAIQEDDVILLRDGHAVGRLERFDDEDWDDWKFEHSPAAIEAGNQARQQYQRGEFQTLSEYKANMTDTDET